MGDVAISWNNLSDRANISQIVQGDRHRPYRVFAMTIQNCIILLPLYK